MRLLLMSLCIAAATSLDLSSFGELISVQWLIVAAILFLRCLAWFC